MINLLKWLKFKREQQGRIIAEVENSCSKNGQTPSAALLIEIGKRMAYTQVIEEVELFRESEKK